MTTLELKNNFHQLIDKVEDDNILTRFYTMLEQVLENKEGKLWSRLSAAEQQEILQIDNETDNEENLIPLAKIQEKHKRWL